MLWDQDSVDGLDSAERVAQSLRLTLQPLKLENPPYDWDTAFRTLSGREAEMLLVLSSALFTPHRARIAELAVRHRLPSMYIFRYYVTAGGLISYGPMYGGNRNNAVWKMIGFPGAIGMYGDVIEQYRNKRYDVEPKSIQDLS